MRLRLRLLPTPSLSCRTCTQRLLPSPRPTHLRRRVRDERRLAVQLRPRLAAVAAVPDDPQVAQRHVAAARHGPEAAVHEQARDDADGWQRQRAANARHARVAHGCKEGGGHAVDDLWRGRERRIDAQHVVPPGTRAYKGRHAAATAAAR